MSRLPLEIMWMLMRLAATGDFETYHKLRGIPIFRQASCLDDGLTIELLKGTSDIFWIGLLLSILKQESERPISLIAPEAPHFGGDSERKREWEAKAAEILGNLAYYSPRIRFLDVSVRSLGWNASANDSSVVFEPAHLSSLIIRGAELDNAPRADTFFGSVNTALPSLKYLEADLCRFRHACFGADLTDVNIRRCAFLNDTLPEVLGKLGKLEKLRSLKLDLDEMDMRAGMGREHHHLRATVPVGDQPANQEPTPIDFGALEILSIAASVWDAKHLFNLVNALRLNHLSVTVKLALTSAATMEIDMADTFERLGSALCRILSSLFPTNTSTHLEIDKSEYEDGELCSLQFKLTGYNKVYNKKVAFYLTVLPHESGGYLGEFLPAVKHLMNWKVVRDLNIDSLEGAECSTGQSGCMWREIWSPKVRKVIIKRSAVTFLSFLRETPGCLDLIESVILSNGDEEMVLTSDDVESIRTALYSSKPKDAKERTLAIHDCVIDDG